MRVFVSIALLLVAACDISAVESSLRDTVETTTAPYRSKRPSAALSVGILQNRQQHTFGFGATGPGDQPRPTDGQTLFEIGSLTKVFTSLSLAVQIERGAITLDDPLSKLLPEWKLSDDAGRITLRELSTHTSGLPRLPLAMVFDVLWNNSNPYIGFDNRRLEHFLSSWKAPQKRPFLYSNLGAGLLGTALTRHSGEKSYESLIRSTVTEPLSMHDTVITLTEDQRARYATGRTVQGQEVASWDFNSLAGAGALRSSVGDLLKFLDAQLHPQKSPLAGAIPLTHRKHATVRGATTIGLGWLILEKDGRTILFHNGATGGYTAFLGFEPASNCGVVLLSNTADAFAQDNSLDKLGFQLLDLLASPALPAADPNPAAPGKS